MADGIDQLSMMIKVLETIIYPVNQSLNRHSEAVQMAVNLIQRLVELYSQEPTRNTIIKELREELQKTHIELKRCLSDNAAGCKESNMSVVGCTEAKLDSSITKMLTVVDDLIEKHEEKMVETISKSEEINKTLNDRSKWLLICIGVSYTVAVPVFFYIHSIIAKVEGIENIVKTLAK